MALKDILGQEKAINILLGTMSRGRIPSSYLFAGESGIGKKYTAINLAKILNCQGQGIGNWGLAIGEERNTNPQPLPPDSKFDCCDICPSCKKIDNQTHPDFVMVAPEKGEIRVEEIRTVEEALSFAPYEGKKKVVIVDNAETMNASAANAFLKTLEEPPSQSLIILIAASPDRLPETIRSRCSRINFSPLSPQKCEQVIKKNLKPEEEQKGKKSEPPDSGASGLLTAAARLSMGRPGLAISNDLIEEREWFHRLLGEMIDKGDNKGIWADKDETEKWFNNAFTVLRDMAALKITGRADVLINADIADKIDAMSKITELKDIIDIYVKLSLLKRYLGFNLNKSITWNYSGFILSKFKRGK